MTSNQNQYSWLDAFPGAITATDQNGIITFMNKCSRERDEMQVGYDLVGHDAIACHPERTQPKVRKLYAEQKHNIYSITKDGRKQLVYQAACFTDGEFSGFVEMVLDLPDEMPHFNRDIPSDPH